MKARVIRDKLPANLPELKGALQLQAADVLAPVTDDFPRGRAQMTSDVHGRITKLLLATPKFEQNECDFQEIYRQLIRKIPANEYVLLSHDVDGNGSIDLIDADTGQPQRPVTMNLSIAGSHGQPGHFDHYREHLRALRSQRAEQAVGERLQPVIRHISVDRKINFDMWIQDYFHVGAISKHPPRRQGIRRKKRPPIRLFLEPNGLVTEKNRIVAELIGTRLEPLVKSREIGFKFEGGNIMVADTFILAGADIQQQNPTLTTAQLEDEMHKRFGSQYQIIWVGCDYQEMGIPDISSSQGFPDGTHNLITGFLSDYRQQPLFHIDLFLTLAGRDERNNYQVVMASPVLGPGMEQEDRPEYDEYVNAIISQLEQNLDRVADSLNKMPIDAGGEIRVVREKNGVRLPITLTYADSESTNPGTPPSRFWFLTSYNNCLAEVPFERDGKPTRVWLPSYGRPDTDWDDLDDFDQQAKDFWLELGFWVNVIEADFIPLASKGGSLHCITKPIRHIRKNQATIN